MKKITLLFFVFLFIIPSLSQTLVDQNLVKANLEFLASDELEGREAATRGEKLASLFIANEFQKYGVKPFGDKNSFYQYFNLNSVKIDMTSNIDVSGTELKLIDDFTFFSKSTSNLVDKRKCVFVGYGITAEEYEYDNYADVDVKGKSVIIMLGEPYSENEQFFDGTKNTKHSGFNVKIENAVKNGASEVIFLPETKQQQAQYWNYLSRSVKSESLVADSEESNKTHMFALSFEGLEKILKNEEVSYQEFMEAIAENEIPESFEFEKEFNYNIKVNSSMKKLRNVVGIVEGTDPELKNEYVTISAHYDHVGFNSPTEVFNGADDNGSGTVAVMEAARMFAKNPSKRSVVFCLFTAEEKGLFGSADFVKNHSSISSTMTNVNLDMVAKGSTDTLFCLGADKLCSELNEIVQKVDEEMTNYVVDLSETNNRLFYQSDHINFHNKGIPAIFFNDMDFSDLHRVTDETKKINWGKLYKSIDLTYRIVKRVGDLDHKLKLDKKQIVNK